MANEVPKVPTQYELANQDSWAGPPFQQQPEPMEQYLQMMMQQQGMDMYADQGQFGAQYAGPAEAPPTWQDITGYTPERIQPSEIPPEQDGGGNRFGQWVENNMSGGDPSTIGMRMAAMGMGFLDPSIAVSVAGKLHQQQIRQQELDANRQSKEQIARERLESQQLWKEQLQGQKDQSRWATKQAALNKAGIRIIIDGPEAEVQADTALAGHNEKLKLRERFNKTDSKRELERAVELGEAGMEYEPTPWEDFLRQFDYGEGGEFLRDEYRTITERAKTINENARLSSEHERRIDALQEQFKTRQLDLASDEGKAKKRKFQIFLFELKNAQRDADRLKDGMKQAQMNLGLGEVLNNRYVADYYRAVDLVEEMIASWEYYDGDLDAMSAGDEDDAAAAADDSVLGGVSPDDF